MNLTQHEIVLDSQVPPDACDAWGSPTPANLAIAHPSRIAVVPRGGFARVDDDHARLGSGWLNVGTELVALTRLRRSRRIRDLPRPIPGVRYLVPRITAAAAWHRSDLVFPVGEVRDATGRILRNTGLGAFPRRWSIAERLRDWRIAAREKRSRQRLNRQWLTVLIFALATALLSGALGLVPGVIDNWQTHGWGGNDQGWTAWLTVGFGAVGTVMLGVATWRWRQRNVIIDARGTAYVIEEQAITWRHEEKASVLAAIAEEFAAVLRVPGPEGLGEKWSWQADAASCPWWDTRVDELVRSFWSVHYNDNHVTHNALFAWAPWPVAMAFGARATARRRGLVLHVRQRPSYGAGGPRQHLRIVDGAHDFLSDAPTSPLIEVASEHALVLSSGSMTVAFETLDYPHPAVEAVNAYAGVRLLAVRLVDAPIGDLPLDSLDVAPDPGLAAVPNAADTAVTIQVSGDLAGRVIPTGRVAVPFDEWRFTTGAHPTPQVPWPAFPAIAIAIADWVVQKAAQHPDDVFLLATRIPQELAVGLGIQLGVRTRFWPRRVFPVFFADGRLVVPNVRLGADSVPAER